MTRRLRPVLVAVCALALAAPAGALAKPCANADALPSSTNLPQIRRATLCLVNKERTRRNRVALRFNRQLSAVANKYAKQMVEQRFFDHVSPGGSTLVTRIEKATSYLSKVTTWALGENLAWGGGDRSTPRQIVTAWMHSPGHRRNILDKRFRELGVGVALGTPQADGGQGATYTNEFGTRRSR